MTNPASSSFVIALDGPAASGKGTLARLLAGQYDLAHLDTGVLYRGVAWVMLDQGLDPADAAAATQAAENFQLSAIEGADIRSIKVGGAASIVAANSGVRAALLEFQRRFAATPPTGRGAVLDGRDIGTVVCPDATVKFYVFASAESRAHRRWLERVEVNPDLREEEVLAELEARDARDRDRAEAPLKPAPDAELLDTTDLSIDASFAAACRIIDSVWRG